MPRVFIILGLLGVIFWVFAVVDCAIQPRYRHRGVSKGAWLLIVTLLPVIGGVMWFTVGRSRLTPGGTQTRRAPDDDPGFIGTLGSISDQDERIRRLEEELAQLDAEDDDPRWNRPPASDAPGDSAATPGTEEGDADQQGPADQPDRDDRPPAADSGPNESQGDRQIAERDSKPDEDSNGDPSSRADRRPGGEDFPGQRGARG